jgi:alpha-L-fucosidase
MKDQKERTQWFVEAKFGLFIHWGPYAVAARGEWVMNRERIPVEEYRKKYAENFKAENYDPISWAELAKKAGMKYIIFTTRHHDGFCLWNTKTTDYNSVCLGPKQDLVAEYVKACRQVGLKVGLYYSVADWSHPDYPDAYARDWPTEWPDEKKRQQFIQFYQEQIRELMTRYGKIDLLWYDGGLPQPLDGEFINKEVYQLQPNIIINDRLSDPYDFRTCEGTINPKGKLWEACMTLNDNWGYHAGDNNWKSTKQVLMMLLETLEKGGNLLLNIGPKPDGLFPEQSINILKELGEWIKKHAEFFNTLKSSPFTWNVSANSTITDNCVYLHLKHNPGNDFCYAEIDNKVENVFSLPHKHKLNFKQSGKRLYLYGLSEIYKDPITTIRIDVKDFPRAATKRTTFWIPN